MWKSNRISESFFLFTIVYYSKKFFSPLTLISLYFILSIPMKSRKMIWSSSNFQRMFPASITLDLVKDPVFVVWLMVYCLYKEVYIVFKCASFWLHGCCGEWEDWYFLVAFLYTFWWRFCFAALSIWHFCLYKGFCHRTESDLLLFSLAVDKKFFLLLLFIEYRFLRVVLSSNQQIQTKSAMTYTQPIPCFSSRKVYFYWFSLALKIRSLFIRWDYIQYVFICMRCLK